MSPSWYLAFRIYLTKAKLKIVIFVLLLRPHFECVACFLRGGLHGGYLELVNFDPSVQIEFDRLISLLVLPIIGQLALEVMLNPLQPGEPSYEHYQEVI